MTLPFFKSKYFIRFSGGDKSLVILKTSRGFDLIGLVRDFAGNVSELGSMLDDIKQDYGRIISQGEITSENLEKCELSLEESFLLASLSEASSSAAYGAWISPSGKMAFVSKMGHDDVALELLGVDNDVDPSTRLMKKGYGRVVFMHTDQEAVLDIDGPITSPMKRALLNYSIENDFTLVRETQFGLRPV